MFHLNQKYATVAENSKSRSAVKQLHSFEIENATHHITVITPAIIGRKVFCKLKGVESCKTRLNGDQIRRIRVWLSFPVAEASGICGTTREPEMHGENS